jgi:CheY-like chemotaxis protein
VDSVSGRGTRISLSAPLAAAAPLPLHAPASQTGDSSIAGTAVLCIDNDENILAGMTALLAGWGCETVAAGNAREAVRLLRASSFAPDLMLVDYHLDEGDGLTAIAEIRRRLGEDVPAILITADRSADLRERATKAGLRVLNKPLKPAALRALMTQWATRRAAAE